MFVCIKCGKASATYDRKTHTFTCKNCGHVDTPMPKVKRCPRCGELYTGYTWFDPSGCPHCGKSFVD